ncbi:hypothetical protein CO180_00075 [candidate division WWE3 bacterium CG_4_9_14_3_um_filter_41_6]|uniref:Uncharacterized protein n=1 Tax=candidate division WWE3 bacterium CG_4_10_14_0_2_um_filter_41_14 TaxID=1975072 RepID=A0A2M7TI69_UNCKA|nr:MAG: hypothetical protein COY32_04225 [candidate division WWE3 bacterium CG_4_10_14_0_2_um_filter_41_14]PJA39743.1 MAG: hypothetical protein CO180_00075 [candidate division WWE3 bacterium CG_4_9_14_3_um_filter_41_6]
MNDDLGRKYTKWGCFLYLWLPLLLAIVGLGIYVFAASQQGGIGDIVQYLFSGNPKYLATLDVLKMGFSDPSLIAKIPAARKALDTAAEYGPWVTLGMSTIGACLLVYGYYLRRKVFMTIISMLLLFGSVFQVFRNLDALRSMLNL